MPSRVASVLLALGAMTLPASAQDEVPRTNTSRSP